MTKNDNSLTPEQIAWLESQRGELEGRVVQVSETEWKPFLDCTVDDHLAAIEILKERQAAIRLVLEHGQTEEGSFPGGGAT